MKANNCWEDLLVDIDTLIRRESNDNLKDCVLSRKSDDNTTNSQMISVIIESIMKLPPKQFPIEDTVSDRVLYGKTTKTKKINNALMCTSLYLQSMDVHV